jgi:hypothetical protein
MLGDARHVKVTNDVYYSANIDVVMCARANAKVKNALW